MGYTLTLDGIKDVEGTPAYKVIVSTPLGSTVTNYYSVESGLKIKNENPASGILITVIIRKKMVY